MDNTVLEDCLVAGLLHETGTLVVLAELPGKWRQISDAMHDPDADIDTVEQEVLGTHRDIIGAFLLGLWGLPDTVVAAVVCNKSPRELLGQVRDTEGEIDLQDLETEIPKAISQSMDGIERISNIVQAMKEFSHPGSGHMELTDINRALRTTVEICRNEWKYHAQVQFDLAPELPAVPVYPGELNQVILNLVVNAAHAIAAKARTDADDGLIRIHTRLRGDWVEIGISDNGCGMSEEVKTRMFEPFFTTKELGKGSGQGLAIAHSVVVDRHCGQIDVDTAPGKDARFSIRLPLHEHERTATTV